VAKTSGLNCAVLRIVFSAAERGIKNVSHDEYWLARENLAEQALRVAETDLDSKDSEKILHRILDTTRTTPTVLKAAKYLAEHDATSELTMNELFRYARNPRQWTPDLFTTYSQIDLTANQRALVDVCRAMHSKAMLELADEISAADSKTSLEQYEAALGSDLTSKLRKANREALAKEVVDAFSHLSEQDGKRIVEGFTVQKWAEWATFSVQHLRLGKKAQGLDGKSTANKAIALSDYQDKVVLIDFWATWCAPCVGELPNLQRLVQQLDPSKFALVGVSLDEDTGRLRQFTAEREIRWPVIADADNSLAMRWQALSLPTYYVLDREHVIRYRGTSLHDAASVARSLVIGSDQPSATGKAISATALFSSLDKNRDGRIEKAELPDDKFFEAVDLNKDGTLSVDELTAFVQKISKTTKADTNQSSTNGHDKE